MSWKNSAARINYTDASLGRELNFRFNLYNNTRSTNETSVTPGNNTFSSCRQSPINIISPVQFVITPPIGFLNIHYKNNTDLQAERKDTHGHISFVTNNPYYITSYNGHDYKLLQYHVHSPAEHQINGHIYNAEVHFVHKDETSNEYLVIAIFLDSTIDNNVFDEAIYETGITNTNTSSVSIDMSKLIIDVFSKDYFTYAGSLTTDPFNDDVTWVIFKHPSGTSSGKTGNTSNAGTPRSTQTSIHPAEVLCFKSV